MKFYHMSDFESQDYDGNGNYVVTALPRGEMTAEEFNQYAKTFQENVCYGVLVIDHVDTETNTVYFYSEIV
jgi:hypothetical protein